MDFSVGTTAGDIWTHKKARGVQLDLTGVL
jgi:hypothetical protein